MKAKLKEFEIVYWELTRISRLVEAPTMTEAIAASEAKRGEGDWDDCQEDSEGTNGVERVYLWRKGKSPKEVYSSGTVAGMVDATVDPKHVIG